MLDPDYVQPASVEEAITALGRAPNDAIVVAGGVVVGSLFNQSLASPALLVDISRIESLRGIEALATGELRLGALVTHEEVLRSTVLRRLTPLLPEMAAEISCPRLRNRGTLGGSLCTIGGQGDPATSLIALGARLALRGADGLRTVLWKISTTIPSPLISATESLSRPSSSANARRKWVLDFASSRHVRQWTGRRSPRR